MNGADAKTDLSIVIAAYNEADGIAIVLDQLLVAMKGAELIVVDDGSPDETAAIVSRYDGVRLLRHEFNQGQGASLKTGMLAATRRFVAWFDGDNEHRVEDLQAMLDRIAANDVAAVIGQRQTGSATLTRAVGKALIRMVGRGLGISAGSDLNCGLRIFRRKLILRYLSLIPNRFSSSLVTTLVMLERGYPVSFVAVRTNPRVGTSTVRLKDGLESGLQLIRAVLLFSPTRFFLPIGLLGAVTGTAYSLAVALLERMGIPVGGMFLTLGGTLVIMLGLIADQISQMRLSLLEGLSPGEDVVTGGAPVAPAGERPLVPQ